jgi:hypothetical protein
MTGVLVTVAVQVYEFYAQPSESAAMGTLYVAVQPPGLPLTALLAQVLSRALGCPFTLPLHPLLEVPDATQLSQLQPVLHAGEVQLLLQALQCYPRHSASKLVCQLALSLALLYAAFFQC